MGKEDNLSFSDGAIKFAAMTLMKIIDFQDHVTHLPQLSARQQKK